MNFVEIDNREKGRIKPAIKFFKTNTINNKKVDVIVKQKEAADFSYLNVGVEFKTVPDFISSVKNGRLKREILQMNEMYDKHFVVIQGSTTQGLKEQFLRVKRKKFSKEQYFSLEQYFGAVASMNQITKMFQVENQNQAFTLILKLFEKSTDGKIRNIPEPELHTKNTIINFLGCIQGINQNKAMKIVNELKIGNLKSLLNLNSEDFATVNGIGEKTADKIVEWIK